MSKAKWFVVVALGMLAVPLRMVWDHEQVLRSGETFLFKTAPIDPRDPFRGEYVSLVFMAEQGDWFCEGLAETDGTQNVYAQLGQDPDGFALITGLSLHKPASGPYILVKASSAWGARPEVVRRVELPFDRFYLQEGQGPRTEQLLRPNRALAEPEDREAWAVVKVRNGRAVVADLVVGGKPIKEWMGEE